jgi:hypothetical protein
VIVRVSRPTALLSGGTSPDEHSRLKVVQALSEKLGPDAAAALMECVPPFSWMEVATKSDLANLEARIGDRFEARLHQEITRSIKWTVGAVFGSIATVAAAATAIAAFVG